MQEMQETWVPSLGWEDTCRKKMATHSNILAEMTPWTEETGSLQSVRSQSIGHDWAIEHTHNLACLRQMDGILAIFKKMMLSYFVPFSAVWLTHFNQGSHTLNYDKWPPYAEWNFLSWLYCPFSSCRTSKQHRPVQVHTKDSAMVTFILYMFHLSLAKSFKSKLS